LRQSPSIMTSRTIEALRPPTAQRPNFHPVTELVKGQKAVRPNDTAASHLLEQLLQLARLSALEEMASGIAHELNQPIGAIATFAQAGQRMLDRPDPMIASSVEVLQHISEQALNAGQGIRRIRGLFNAPESVHSTCEPADVVMELMPVLHLLANRWGSELELSLQPDLAGVSIDRLRIQHVLLTLVQNALEAQGEVDSTPNVRIQVTGDRYGVCVAVEDKGSGVQDVARENLFHPFFTTKQNGTGLGLASSRAIIEAHEGTIGFENLPAGGARFWFRLPAVPAA
jgi:two-component system sensor kinase FixL